MRTLYIDCAMGCAGDMLTAALLELHPDRDGFIERMNAALNGRAVIRASADSKCGISGTHVSVLIGGEEEGSHDHGCHHHHTSAAEIMNFIGSVSLPEPVRRNAEEVYRIIVEAESAVHGEPVENIHLHEVGSLDALADVLSVCALIYELEPGKILSSEVNVGSGFVKCAHGELAVPVPAVAHILTSVPVYSGNVRSELCTPTGAALLKHFASGFGPMPVLKLEKTGYGTGKKDFDTANVVRALIGETESGREQLTELVCNLDDMTPEEVAFTMEELFAAGALDVYTTNIGMKKCRQGLMLTCMCRAEQRDRLIACMFRNTTTLGVREYVCSRYNMKHGIETVETELGSVRIKTAEGYGTKHIKCEYEDMAGIARSTGRTLQSIRAEVLRKSGGTR